MTKIIFEQASNLSSGLLHEASRIIRTDASKHQQPGPFVIGILKPTHIEQVLMVARQATRDWVPGGGIDPFIQCGKSCRMTRLDITEHLDRNKTITRRRLREQRLIAKDYYTSDTVLLGMSCTETEMF